MRRLGFVILWLAVLGRAGFAWGAVMPISGEKLAQQAEAIAVARVSAVHDVSGVRVAEAEVLRIIKGPASLTRLYFLANRRGHVTPAPLGKGERVLLFLDRSSSLKETEAFWKRLRRLTGGAFFFEIAHSGRGRMPITESDDGDVVAPEVRLPEEMVLRWPDRKGLPLEEFISFVEASLAAHSERP